MVAYSFQKQFIRPIVEGSKHQTIRPIGKRLHATRGQVLQLYTAMRTKHCRLIGRAHCLDTGQIELDFPGERVRIKEDRGGLTTIYPGGLDEFAEFDGFEDWPALRAFWATHHDLSVFQGMIIRWMGFRAWDGSKCPTRLQTAR